MTGEGAADALRFLITAMIANGNANVLEVVISQQAAQRLIPGADAFDGLRLVENVSDVVSAGEVALLRRARLFEEIDAIDLASYRLGSNEPLPTLLLIVDDLDNRQTSRISTLAGFGARLGCIVVTLGAHVGPLGKIVVGADGKVNERCGDALQEFEEMTMHRVSESECRDILATLAAATEVDSDLPAVANTRATDALSPPNRTGFSTPRQGTSVRVQLFGAYQIEAGGNEIKTGLRTAARELLAYHLLHPQGATVDASVDALRPDLDLEKVSDWFWSALGNLRSTLRKSTGLDRPFIEKRGLLYIVEADVFEVDIWGFQEALASASDLNQAIAEEAIQKTLNSYSGELLRDMYYGWVEPLREEFRKRSLDCRIRMAELLELDGNVEGALRTVEGGIAVDPYAEALYHHAFRLLAVLERPLIARQLFRQLTSLLAEIDVDPSEETVRVFMEVSKESV